MRLSQCIGSQHQCGESHTLIDESGFWGAAAGVKGFPYNGDQQAAEKFRAFIKAKIWTVYAWDKKKQKQKYKP